jgi:hypothetical protein
MSRICFLCILFMNFQTINGNPGSCPAFPEFAGFNELKQDTLPDNQILYNGRVWRNLNTSVKENQFLFSREFLPGSVTMRGKTFSNIWIKYDIFKDEILTPGDQGKILQLNKEMVDSFSLFFQNIRYQFVKIRGDSLTGLEGYCNILYRGKYSLYVKYIKKIGKLAEEGKYDKFYQINKIYLFKDGVPHPVTGKNDLVKLLSKNKTAIRNFTSKNNITVSKENPASFIPVLSYMETLK